MWLKNYLFCLVQGHVLSAFTYKGAEYHCCMRCGKIEFARVFKRNSSIQDSSQHFKREAAGILRMTNMTR